MEKGTPFTLYSTLKIFKDARVDSESIEHRLCYRGNEAIMHVRNFRRFRSPFLGESISARRMRNSNVKKRTCTGVSKKKRVRERQREKMTQFEGS